MFQDIRGVDAVLLSIGIFVAVSLVKLIVSIGLFIKKGPARAIEKSSTAKNLPADQGEAAKCTNTEKLIPDTNLQITGTENLAGDCSKVCPLLGGSRSRDISVAVAK